jgi:hypothetical protein
VYEILYKDRISGNLVSHEEMLNLHEKSSFGPSNDNQVKSNKKINFLIYIVNKQVTINDKLHTLTFVKDITFGVLYD